MQGSSLEKKNSGACLRCLDYPPVCRKGSPIFSICLKSLSLLKTDLHWIPGNGKHINIWDDPIMGMKPIGQNPRMAQLKIYLQSQNITTLWSESARDTNNNNSWKGWQITCPPHLEDEKVTLLYHLQGNSPVSMRSKDSRGWGTKSGAYSTAAGYNLLVRHQTLPMLAIWKSI